MITVRTLPAGRPGYGAVAAGARRSRVGVHQPAVSVAGPPAALPGHRRWPRRSEMSPTVAQIRAMPKVLLHDHLDGGLRPQTVIDLADDAGYSGLPSRDPGELAQVLAAGANRGHLN